MIKMNIKQVLILLVGLITISFKTTDNATSDNLSVLIVKLRYDSYGMVGFGGSLIVRNLETNDMYQSKSKIGFNPFVIVENLPLGNYKIEKLEIISGSNVLSLNDEFIFNTLKIDTPKIYNLGSFMTKKIPPLMELNFKITRTENDENEKIYKKVKRMSEKWQDLQIDSSHNLFVKDTTIIKI